MKVPHSIPYKQNLMTWPASATPDYVGTTGFILHDGTVPVFKTVDGDYVDLPDEIAEIVDPMIKAAIGDNLTPHRENFKRYGTGIAIYGHLVGEYFFARFLLDLEVARGKRASKGDLAMHRATLMRVMGTVGALHTEYEGGFYMAPSVPVLNETAFAKICTNWNGKPSIHCQLRFRPHPVVRCRGAIITDTLVEFNARAPMSLRPSPDQLEEFSL
jgi:hypothetical protein